MSRPRLLDLFCGAGGAAVGYHRAGFDVVGVDIRPQPRYPFEFHQGDALEFLAEHGGEFDAIHASPPCHDHSALKSRSGTDGTGWLLDATRQALSRFPVTVLENTPGADMRVDLRLCGGMFGLRTYRHRWFEITGPLMLRTIAHPKHRIRTSTKKRRACWDAGLHVSVTGDVSVCVGSQAMGIDWMTGAELSQAIPPDYTAFIGEQLHVFLRADGGHYDGSLPARTHDTAAFPVRRTDSHPHRDALAGSVSSGDSRPSRFAVNGRCSPVSSRDRGDPD